MAHEKACSVNRVSELVIFILYLFVSGLVLYWLARVGGVIVDQ